MDIDNLRSAWNSQLFNAPQSDDAERRRNLMRAGAFNEQLKRRTLTMTVLPFAIIPIILACFDYLALPDWLDILSIVTLVAMSIINGFVWHKVSHLSLGDIDMRAALRRTINLRKLIVRSRIVAIAAATPLITAVLIEYYYILGTHVLTGGIAGIVIGAAIGTSAYRRTMTIVNRLQTSLSSLTDE